MAERREGAADHKIQTEALPKSAIYAEMVVSDRPGRLWVMRPAVAAITADVSLSSRAALTSRAVNWNKSVIAGPSLLQGWHPRALPTVCWRFREPSRPPPRPPARRY